MNDKECKRIYDELASLYPTHDLSWKRLRELIKEVKDIVKKCEVEGFDTNLNNYLDSTWTSNRKNCSKDNFNGVVKEFRDAVFTISLRLSS